MFLIKEADYLQHFGVLGMHWGVRKEERRIAQDSQKKYISKVINSQRRADKALTKEEFDKLSTKDIKIQKNQDLNRISSNKEKKLRAGVWVSYTKKDLDRYKVAISNFKTKNPGWLINLKTVNDLLIPSEKVRIQTYIDLLDDNFVVNLKKNKINKGRDYVESMLWQYHFYTGGVMGGIQPKEIKALSSVELGRRSYNAFTYSMGNTNSPLASTYIKKLAAKGYNATIDDWDAGRVSDAPLYIFDAKKDVKRIGAIKIKNKDLRNTKVIDLMRIK